MTTPLEFFRTKVQSARDAFTPLTLISRHESQVKRASLALGRPPRLNLVLRGGDKHIEPGATTNLLQVLGDDEIWRRRRIVMDTSITDELHPVAANAVVQLVQESTMGSAVKLKKRRTRKNVDEVSADSKHLAAWIANRVRESDVHFEYAPVMAEELEYFLGSSAQRARRLATVLERTVGDRKLPEIVDIGGGIGLIPWLIATDPSRGVERVTVVDPSVRYAYPWDQLWLPFKMKHGPDSAIFAAVNAEAFEFRRPVDLILSCQSIYNLPRHLRGAIFRRGWDALRPGGILAINEIVVSDDLPDAEIAKIAHSQSPRRSEILALCKTFGRPHLYRSATGFKLAEDPENVPAREWGSDNFLVIQHD
jgi:hypothetical protein